MAETPSPKRLVLLDGMALVYRAHFALIGKPIRTSQQFVTSAVYGFINTYLDLLDKQSPTHIAVAFDTSHPTFRHEWFEEYKGTREEMPEDLALQIPVVKEFLKACQVPVLEYPGWEADDVMGTFARLADEEGGFETLLVTPDKDFAQLVTATTSIYKPGRKGGDAEILDEAAICEQWGVEKPEQTIDILALWGDTSDNIPGVPGVGQKTAQKLVANYGSVEGLLENITQLKGKQKENVENSQEQARLSKKLVIINREAPVKETWSDLERSPWDESALRSLFTEYEFTSLGKRLFGADFESGRGNTATNAANEVQATLKTLADIDHSYRLIAPEDRDGRAALIAELASASRFCFDIETDSLDPKTAQVIGLAFCQEKGKAVYVVVDDQAIVAEFTELFARPEIEKIGHNLKYDLAVLQWHGVPVAGPFFDTMLAHSVLHPDQRHKMDYLAESLLAYKTISYDEAFGGKVEETGQLSLFADEEVSDAEDAGPNLELIRDYACEDADVTWQLAEILRADLEKDGQLSILTEIEFPLLPVLVEMEVNGIRVDPAVLAESGVRLQEKIDDVQRKVVDAAGEDFNLSSPKQVGQILFEKLKLVEKPKKTKSGQFKTDEQTLTALAAEHEIVANLLKFREASKLKNTYVDALPESIFERTGRIHTTFHQLLTATGRLASNQPNLQNIPIRSDEGREIRRAFVPAEGATLLAADYSQIELRVMASLSEDDAMMEAFLEGVDIHTATSARVFGVSQDEVTSDMRRTAKMVNFGIIYGISAFGLAQRLGGEVSRSEAGDIIEEYFRQYAGVKAFQEKTIEDAKKNGYVETLSGRRRYLPDIDSRNGMVRSGAERTAINTPIQGTAADMIKLAMVRVEELLRAEKAKTKLLLQVHDELVFDLALDERDDLVPKIEAAMRDALPLKVPILVESGIGTNWLEAH